MTKVCVSCDTGAKMTPFAGETHVVTYKKRMARVAGLSGHRCPECGEVEFDQESAEKYAAAGDSLVLATRRAVGAELRRIRKRLKLTQKQAGDLTGGGHNAISRYETGAVLPTLAVINLFRLLELHPKGFDELKKPQKAKGPVGAIRRGVKKSAPTRERVA
jgi:HTH-type transcriptional regulator/antitoxin MqsA